MKRINSIWFNEDGDRVWGIKSAFVNEKEFIKEVNKEHLELTGYGCIVEEVGTDIFLSVDEPLEGEYLYRLADCGASVETLYYADCESLENYDTKDGDETVEIQDGILINLKGERVYKCDICERVITLNDYKNKDGICNECGNNISDK
ncbi:hypothetical protein [Clostridium sp. 1001275B_160808_H3]|uniref:hypothetical protein n=1 Tax=Clostridium sp. 1001275B_160808_H3 TaxID=2787110 RepID=UPI001896E126|nr:hypothetical protein [Clostridium sp. 1001275B_160808_H3]